MLLYGLPGTGKTLIADVVAKECNLNFISVKVRGLGGLEVANLVIDTFI